MLTEGEKAAQALIDVGIPAVATTTGANGCPSRTVLGELGGLQVLPWPDLDDAGLGHMRKVSVGLEGIAAPVRLIQPPADRPLGWDAADALTEPGGRELVQNLVDAAIAGPEFHPDQTTQPRTETKRLPTTDGLRFDEVQAETGARRSTLRVAPAELIGAKAVEHAAKGRRGIVPRPAA